MPQHKLDTPTSEILYLSQTIVNTSTADAMLAVWMVPIIWRLQASVQDRLLPCMLLGSRLSVCALQLSSIAYMARTASRGRSPFHGADSTWTAITFWMLNM